MFIASDTLRRERAQQLRRAATGDRRARAVAARLAEHDDADEALPALREAVPSPRWRLP